VIEAASRLFPKPSSKSKKSRKSDTSAAVEAGEGMPPPVDILVDVIIGFLEESTSYMRTVANQVFTLLSATVERSETVDLILTVSPSFKRH
jgi:DNA polymerase phi